MASVSRLFGNVFVSFSLRNPGPTTATNVRITGMTLAGKNTTNKLPLTLGTLAVNSSATVGAVFPNMPSLIGTLTVVGTSSLGSFTSTVTVGVP